MAKTGAEGDFPQILQGAEIPYTYYGLRFDETGACVSPRTRERLVEDVKAGGYTDVFVFSHGWNNDWYDAEDLYARFIQEFHRILGTQGLSGQPYRPLWVGVRWPSTILVLPWEQGPAVAVYDPAKPPAPDEPAVAALLSRLSEAEADRVRALTARPTLDPEGARELLGLLVKAAGEPVDEEMPGLAPPGVDALLDAWAADQAAQYEDVGDGEPVLPGAPGAIGRPDTPEAAGKVFGKGRDAVRVFTVWPMKDRAGLVGRFGVGPLIRELRDAAPGASLRLIGHSFGAKVVLSALGSPEFADRRADSALLLQPAVSARCFAADAVNGSAGGYREVPRRVALPITMTFSNEDDPLHGCFHLAVCRRYDIGERQPAPAGAPVPIFAALGGYGPQRVPGEATVWPIQEPFDAYPVPAGRVATPLLALNGAGVIHDHGDVKNPATAWAQYYLMTPEATP